MGGPLLPTVVTCIVTIITTAVLPRDVVPILVILICGCWLPVQLGLLTLPAGRAATYNPTLLRLPAHTTALPVILFDSCWLFVLPDSCGHYYYLAISSSCAGGKCLFCLFVYRSDTKLPFTRLFRRLRSAHSFSPPYLYPVAIVCERHLLKA